MTTNCPKEAKKTQNQKKTNGWQDLGWEEGHMTDQQPLPEVVGKAVKRQMISRVQVKRHFKIYVVSVLMTAFPSSPPCQCWTFAGQSCDSILIILAVNIEMRGGQVI